MDDAGESSGAQGVEEYLLWCMQESSKVGYVCTCHCVSGRCAKACARARHELLRPRGLTIGSLLCLRSDAPRRSVLDAVMEPPQTDSLSPSPKKSRAVWREDARGKRLWREGSGVVTSGHGVGAVGKRRVDEAWALLLKGDGVSCICIVS